MLIIYLYISLAHSITQRFKSTSQYIKLSFRTDILTDHKVYLTKCCELKSILENLMELCGLLEEINNSFGKLIFIAVVMIFVWTVADFYGILYKTLTSQIKSILVILAYLFSSVNELVIFVLIYVCDRCGKQVSEK